VGSLADEEISYSGDSMSPLYFWRGLKYGEAGIESSGTYVLYFIEQCLRGHISGEVNGNWPIIRGFTRDGDLITNWTFCESSQPKFGMIRTVILQREIDISILPCPGPVHSRGNKICRITGACPYSSTCMNRKKRWHNTWAEEWIPDPISTRKTRLTKMFGRH
jgi:hypothetical protein